MSSRPKPSSTSRRTCERPGQVKSSQAKPSQVKPSQAKPSQAKPRQVTSSHAKSSQATSSQAKSSQTPIRKLRGSRVVGVRPSVRPSICLSVRLSRRAPRQACGAHRPPPAIFGRCRRRPTAASAASARMAHPAAHATFRPGGASCLLPRPRHVPPAALVVVVDVLEQALEGGGALVRPRGARVSAACPRATRVRVRVRVRVRK